MTKYFLIALFAMMPCFALAQGTTVPQNIVVTNSLGRPLGGIKVEICNTSSPSAPTCSSAASIYTDSALTHPIACSASACLTTDSLGRVPIFFALPGTYCYTVSGSYISDTSCQLIVLYAASGGVAVLTNPTGTQNISGDFPLNVVTGGFSANGQFTPKTYGAKGDVITLTDGAITNTLTAFTSSSATFTANDVGKAIVVSGAASSGNALVTTITAFVSSTAVTLANPAGTTVSGTALTYYGTDDTAAIKSCVANGTALGKRCTLTNGMTFMMSNTASTVQMFGTGTGGILDGSGTIIFAPTGTLTAGVNDRFLYIKSTEATPIQLAAGAIAKGATSFTAQNAGDVSTWAKGDWLVLCEHDAGFGDCLYVDWMQVSSVSSATVNVITPFRMAFPNARTWNVSGSPANCVVGAPCGLSARKITNITNATLRDFHLIVPKIAGGVSGVGLRDTRGVTLDNLDIQNASQDGFFSYLDQGLTIKNTRINNITGPTEIAATVDFTFSGLQMQPVGTALNGYAATAATCMTIDIGSGFGTIGNSVCGPTLVSSMFLNGGVHDVTVNTNHIAWVHGTSQGAAINCIGCYRVAETANVLDGGDGSSIGINFSDTSGYTVNINSDSNFAAGNVVNGFPTNFSCATANLTDNCEDYFATVANARTIRNSQHVGFRWGENDVTLANGANNNINPGVVNAAQGNYIRVVGPTGGFSVSGFTGGVTGMTLILSNPTTQQMTITNEGGASTATNRITTRTGADVVLRAGTSTATFFYEGTRWILQNSN